MTELFRILKMTLQVIFSILIKLFKFEEKYSQGKTNLFSGKSELQMIFSYFWPPSILSSINLCGTFCQITRVRNTAQT